MIKTLTALAAFVAAFVVPLGLVRWLDPANPRYDTAIYFGTGLVILWYTLETRGMRQEMFRTRLRLETPEVNVRLDRPLDPNVYSGFFDVVVENVSQTHALDVTFTEVPDLPVGADRRTTDIGFLRYGIRNLAPGEKYRAFFLDYPHLGSDAQRQDVQFAYSFKDRTGKEYARSFTINLSVYVDAMALGRPFEAGVLEELRSIRETLRELFQPRRVT